MREDFPRREWMLHTENEEWSAWGCDKEAAGNGSGRVVCREVAKVALAKLKDLDFLPCTSQDLPKYAP